MPTDDEVLAVATAARGAVRRHSDPAEHERVPAASGPGGWHCDADSRFR